MFLREEANQDSKPGAVWLFLRRRERDPHTAPLQHSPTGREGSASIRFFAGLHRIQKDSDSHDSGLGRIMIMPHSGQSSLS